jgi:methylglutaconyl-CoA hydratase
VSDVLAHRDGAVATLTLHRPARRNALDPAMLESLGARLVEVSSEPSVRVVVLTGAGDAFSAGADIEAMRAAPALSQERNLEDAAAMQAAFEAVDACPTPVIARVNGAAIGGGAGLVACADFAIASDDARFAFAEVRLGLLPALISPYVLRAIGPGHARALFTSGRSFGAEEARRLGLVHDVAAVADLDARVAEAVEGFVAGGPHAIAACKRLIRDATTAFRLPDLPLRIASARASAEGSEGIAAFLEKRAPHWATSDGS